MIPSTWLPLIARRNDHPFDGEPRVRDVNAPCRGYEPVAMPAGNGPCDTDGHYLCLTCSEHSRAAYDALKRLP